ncbi:6-phosphogluconolactonase [Flavobacterium sp. 7E]|uniref:lactonase family protein n=1 Tax=Flavobacterium sp. 7E TaxID=2735898 RepID=UPI0015711378|nr:lactonase family protein [Flavobacterium sp. 7E]NRS88202.1 6-phosphogluconolactonase [Flavobacterium sp. 7E]
MKRQYFTFVIILLISTIQAQNKDFNLVIGTYTNSCESNGIYLYNFNSETGDFSYENSSSAVVNPSYLSVSTDNKFIYSVNENGDKSYVSAFSYKANKATVAPLNKQETKGADPCYLINDEKNIITANYSGGSITVLEKNNDGSIGEIKQLVQHHGKGVNASRQEGPHVHMVQFSPDKKFVLATDLGTDQVFTYAYDANAKETPLKFVDSMKVAAGSGPRHLTFNDDGKYLYLVHELDGALTVYSHNEGQLKKIQTTSILTKGFKGKFTAAAIAIAPNGKFLYVTNRGEANTISTFEILKNGKLKSKGEVSTLGDGPRSFAIDPTGNYLLVAHQYSNNVVVFKRDIITGALTDTGKRIELCAPVCLVFTEQ